jgi:hypothetical protein
MAKVRVFSIVEDLKEVVPNGLYMKHWLGETISVSIVKFVEPEGPNLPAKAHSHGEEASLQLRGACSVFHGQGDAARDPEYRLEQGDAMIIAAENSHYGTNRFDPQACACASTSSPLPARNSAPKAPSRTTR